MAKKRSDEIKAALRQPGQLEQLTDDRFLSTGSTLLNLACTGRLDGGLLKGHYYQFVGDSKAGKTWITLSCLAEASINPVFDGYRLLYDNVEGGALMDLRRFFGERAADRIEPPATKDGEAVYSQTVEQFYFHVDDLLKAGRPFIYVLDSQDALSSDAEREKFQERKQAFRKGREAAGSYGDSKAKGHSSDLRKLMGPLRDSGSILLLISQSRDSFNPFEGSVYSGGRALKFYATLQLWATVKGTIDRTIRGKKRQLGTIVKVAVRKNRVTGRDRSVLIPIYHSYGIDDVGSCVDYLTSEGAWEADGARIEAVGLGPTFSGTREEVVRWIEGEKLTDDLRLLVGETWNEIEKACEIERAKRY